MDKKVLIVDDSALIREILTEIIDGISGFTVVGTASDPHVGADKVMKLKPDIITLDIEMPKMDGLTFLDKLMHHRPIPVLIISSLSQRNSTTALKALELGAIDYVTKPVKSISTSLKDLTEEIKGKLDVCANCNVEKPKVTKKQIDQKYSADAVISVQDKKSSINFETTDKVIAIGASTGGTVALGKLFQQLPDNLPGIVVVQHMPPGFTKSFADRLNTECKLYVKEAEDNDTILSGQALIAPGDKHLVVNRSGTRFYVNVIDGPPVNRHKPSVDVLFRSVSQKIGMNSVGVILTGMGDDGAEGMLEMKDVGAHNIAQDEASSTVFGMPKVAIDKGGVHEILSLDAIGKYLLKYQIS